MKENKHNFYFTEIKALKFPHAVWQSFPSIFPHLSGGTMATSQTCCHLPGEILNSAAECADRARIQGPYEKSEEAAAAAGVEE
jgi:hypothetical protein